MNDSTHIRETQAHCNACSGNRNHEILWSGDSPWEDDGVEDGIYGNDTYELVKCRGCGSIKLRLMEWCSEVEGKRVTYFPSAVFRTKPRWLVDLMLEVDWNADNSVCDLLSEIYVALQNDQRALAAMGIRALLEKVMIDKCGDRGYFSSNLKAFEDAGYVSRMQRERLETILEAGHAAMHRFYKPKQDELLTLVDIAESLVESIYIHGTKIERLKNGIPPRKPSAKI